MIFGHTFELGNDLVRSYVYAFHMPAFFIVSGFLYKNKSISNIIVSILFPFFIFSLFSYCFEVIKHGGLLPISDISDLVSLRFDDNGGLFVGVWFLWALLGLKLIFLLSFVRKQSMIISLIIICIFSILPQLGLWDGGRWHIFRSFSCFPFFALGHFLRSRNLDVTNLPKKIVLVISIITLFLSPVNTPIHIPTNHYGINYSIFVINAILSSVVLIYLVDKLPKTKYVEIISKGTFLILGIHFPILQLILSYFPMFLMNYASFIAPFLVLIICYPIIVLSLKYCPCILGITKKK